MSRRKQWIVGILITLCTRHRIQFPPFLSSNISIATASDAWNLKSWKYGGVGGENLEVLFGYRVVTGCREEGGGETEFHPMSGKLSIWETGLEFVK